MRVWSPIIPVARQPAVNTTIGEQHSAFSIQKSKLNLYINNRRKVEEIFQSAYYIGPFTFDNHSP